MVLLALVILLARTLWMLGVNTTTIEGWEISRHKTLLRRARVFGGYLDGPGGIKVRIQKQEFPYDIGLWQNIKAGMDGSANVDPFSHCYLNPIPRSNLLTGPLLVGPWLVLAVISWSTSQYRAAL